APLVALRTTARLVTPALPGRHTGQRSLAVEEAGASREQRRTLNPAAAVGNQLAVCLGAGGTAERVRSCPGHDATRMDVSVGSPSRGDTAAVTPGSEAAGGLLRPRFRRRHRSPLA